MTTQAPSDRVTVVIQRPQYPGLLAGAFSCAFGLFGFFAFALVFVPLALLCAAVGLTTGILGRGAVGIGTSLLGGLLAFISAVTSPTIMLIFAGSVLASNMAKPELRPQLPPAWAVPPPVTGVQAQAASAPEIQVRSEPQPDPAPAPQQVVDGQAAEAMRQASQITSAIQWGNRFNADAARYIAGIHAIEVQYRQVVSRADDRVAQFQTLNARDRSGVAGAQTFVNVAQDGVAIDQLGIQTDHIARDIEGVQPKIAAFKQSSVPCEPQSPTASVTGCDRLWSIAQDVRVNSDTMDQALSELQDIDRRARQHVQDLGRSGGRS